MPSKIKNKKNVSAKKAVKSRNKKVSVKNKKRGKTVTFQARPATDPLAKKVNVETGVRPAAAFVPQVPSRPHPMMACACGDLNCCASRQQPQQQNPNEIPSFIRELAEDMGNQIGAQHVMVVGISLNPANPRTEPPSNAEVEGLLRSILGR